jgi:hypothetical protein
MSVKYFLYKLRGIRDEDTLDRFVGYMETKIQYEEHHFLKQAAELRRGEILECRYQAPKITQRHSRY